MTADALRHHRAGRANQAEQLYRQSLALDSHHADTWNLLGLLLLETGRPALAVDALRHAVVLNGAVASYRSNLGNALKANGQLRQAIASYCDALSLRADDQLALNNLAAALWQQGQFDKAAVFSRRAIELDPNLAEAHNNLGNALNALEATAEAVPCYRRAIELRPDFPVARTNLGTALIALQRFDEAVECFRTALDFRPDCPDTHYNLAFPLLATGRMTQGWVENEWRWKTPHMIKEFRAFPQAQWRGEAAEGKSLLIHAEQGWGDTLQFCRYAALAAARGLRVILAAPAPLVRLLRTVPGVDQVVPEGETLPPFDLHCPMLSLPLAFGTTLETVPAPAAYLSAEAGPAAAWRNRLAALPNTGVRVGLVWACNPLAKPAMHSRNLPPALLAPLFDIPGCQFFSLQKAGAKAPDGFMLHDHMDQMGDFADTAALIANLDLVISVDTAVAHLAGAMGKPVWLLLRSEACWRWLAGRRDSPWYPSARLYRQTTAGAWDSVMAEVTTDLISLVERFGSDKAATPGEAPPSTVQDMIADALRHHRAGQASQAEQLYRQVLTLDAHHAGAWNLFGLLLLETGRHVLAVDVLRRAVALDGAVASYRSNLGNALKANGQLQQAIASYCDALALRADDPLALNNLGAALWQQGQFDQAAMLCRRAIELDPNMADAHNNLGNAINDLEGAAAAIACYRKAIELRPDFPVARNNLGNALIGLRRFKEAIDCFRQALDIRPDSPDTHYNLALALLALGHFAEGWVEHEWRWKGPQIKEVREFPQPLWRGEPAAGRTLLIHAEQGFGDTLQFCRYAALVAARGLRVMLAVPKPLVRVLRDVPGVSLVVEDGEQPPAYDLHCPMLSLPLALGTTLATIPASVPYLRADAAQAERWQARLAAMPNQGPRIGLAWAGNPRASVHTLAAIDRRRSLPPDRLAPLFDVPGLHFFSLQKGGPAAPAAFGMTDCMPEMHDFADTAALIVNLDLVICVDTAVAHLAAGLGKPVWLLDRFDSCWRWLDGRRDSPWYPTLRIYRQVSPNEWDPVVAEVARDLVQLGSRAVNPPAR